MARIGNPTTSASRGQRYRDAELRLWHYYGLDPKERFLDLEAPAARLRVLEVGSGEPILFVHGTAGPGSWPSLIAQLPDFRSIVLDRPGWGASTPIDFSRDAYGPLVADILRGALDALELDRANVIGASIGDVWVLRLAERHPTRVGRIVLMGGGPVVADVGVPRIIRLLATPLGAVMVRRPDQPNRVRSILRQLGHGPSLDAGRIPDEFIDWRVTVAHESDSMRHEREMIRAIVKGRSYRPGLTFDDDALAAIQPPTVHLFGTADPTGSADIWQRVADVLPRGELRLIEAAGHMPWFDDPAQIAGTVRRFLTMGSAPAGGFVATTGSP